MIGANIFGFKTNLTPLSPKEVGSMMPVHGEGITAKTLVSLPNVKKGNSEQPQKTTLFPSFILNSTLSIKNTNLINQKN